MADTGRFRDLGILILRLGMGTMFVGHGVPKLLAGPEKWEAVGGAMNHLGIHFAPTVWGLLAALSECGGGILMAAGVLYLPACLAMLSTMIVACVMHVSEGGGFATTSHAAEAAIVFLSMALLGPGPWRIRLTR
jgi:putative oxidoreductase